MLKRLVIFIALASGTVYPARPQIPRDGGQQNRPTRKEADKRQPAQPAPPTLQVQLGPAKQEHDTDQKPSGYPWKELLAPANIPNWGLCLIGVIAGWAAVRTLRAIRRQADLMKQQSDMFISRERARIQVKMLFGTLAFLYPGYSFPKENPPSREIEVEIQHDGDTSAYNAHADCSVSVSYSSGFVIHTETKLCHIGILKPSEDRTRRKRITIYSAISDDHIILIHAQNAILRVAGIIRYEDVFGIERETAFQYRWKLTLTASEWGGTTHSGTWEIDGPTSANRAT